VGQLIGCLLRIEMFNLLFPLARPSQVHTPFKASYRSSWELLPGMWWFGIYVLNPRSRICCHEERTRWFVSKFLHLFPCNLASLILFIFLPDVMMFLNVAVAITCFAFCWIFCMIAFKGWLKSRIVAAVTYRDAQDDRAS
jgi:hypothetical protein